MLDFTCRDYAWDLDSIELIVGGLTSAKVIYKSKKPWSSYGSVDVVASTWEVLKGNTARKKGIALLNEIRSMMVKANAEFAEKQRKEELKRKQELSSSIQVAVKNTSKPSRSSSAFIPDDGYEARLRREQEAKRVADLEQDVANMRLRNTSAISPIVIDDTPSYVSTPSYGGHSYDHKSHCNDTSNYGSSSSNDSSNSSPSSSYSSDNSSSSYSSSDSSSSYSSCD